MVVIVILVANDTNPNTKRFLTLEILGVHTASLRLATTQSCFLLVRLWSQERCKDTRNMASPNTAKQWGKNGYLVKGLQKNWLTFWRKIKPDPYITLYSKVRSRQIKALNVKINV